MHNLFNEKEEFLKVSTATVGEGSWVKVVKVVVKEIVETVVVATIFDGDEK
ncbi:MAG: hypothetical protein Q4F69_04840 [Bacteroidia bacterium]|nr:hypothetical protein [Bacteroidia bacterium]